MTRLTPAVNAAKQALKKAESAGKAATPESQLLEELKRFEHVAPMQTNRSLPGENLLTRQQIGQAKFENDHLILNQSKSGKDLTTRAERQQYIRLAKANVKSQATQQITREVINSTLDNAKNKVRQFFSKIFNAILSPFKGIYNFFKNAGQKISGKKAEAATTGNEATATETKNAKTPKKTTKLKTD